MKEQTENSKTPQTDNPAISISGMLADDAEDDQIVKCCRCRNEHKMSERVQKRTDKKYLIFDVVCPRCGGRSYYRDFR